MAMITKDISIDVSKENTFEAIVAKQNDSNSRFLKVTILNEGEKIDIQNSSVVTINALREDGNAEAFFGTVNDDGTVTVPLSNWMLELDGYVKCDISIMDESDRKLTTTLFTLKVEESAYGDTEITDDPNYDVLTTLINDVSASAGIAETAAAAATVAGEYLESVGTNISNACLGKISGMAARAIDVSGLSHPLAISEYGICKGLPDAVNFTPSKITGCQPAVTIYGKNLIARSVPTTPGFVPQYRGLDLSIYGTTPVTVSIRLKPGAETPQNLTFGYASKDMDSGVVTETNMVTGGAVVRDSLTISERTGNTRDVIGARSLVSSPWNRMFDAFDVLVEVGTSKTGFEEYKEPIQCTVSDLSGQPVILYGLPVSSGGNVTINGQPYISDYIIGNELHRCVGRDVWNGTENWQVGGVFDSSQSLNRPEKMAGNTLICTHLPLRELTTNDSIWVDDSEIIVKNAPNTSTTSAWETYLGGQITIENPVTIYYFLSEETIEQVSAQTVTSIYPSMSLFSEAYMDIEYHRDITAVIADLERRIAALSAT